MMIAKEGIIQDKLIIIQPRRRVTTAAEE